MKTKKTLGEISKAVAWSPEQWEERGNMQRSLQTIAMEVYDDWKPVNYSALPYLEAMGELDSIEDDYYYDTGRSVVRYFLANASTWRGDTARKVKAELKGML